VVSGAMYHKFVPIERKKQLTSARPPCSTVLHELRFLVLALAHPVLVQSYRISTAFLSRSGHDA